MLDAGAEKKERRQLAQEQECVTQKLTLSQRASTSLVAELLSRRMHLYSRIMNVSLMDDSCVRSAARTLGIINVRRLFMGMDRETLT
jgi:hypothetical protein